MESLVRRNDDAIRPQPCVLRAQRLGVRRFIAALDLSAMARPREEGPLQMGHSSRRSSGKWTCLQCWFLPLRSR